MQRDGQSLGSETTSRTTLAIESGNLKGPMFVVHHSRRTVALAGPSRMEAEDVPSLYVMVAVDLEVCV